MNDNRWMTGLKGLIIGSTMIVPGVSGGSMAMILGIYDKLILAVSSFRKDIKENLLFLLWFVLCAGIGMFLFSAPLQWLLLHYEMPTMYFFLGAVFGSIPFIERKSQIRRISWDVVLYMLLGAGSILLISQIPDAAEGNAIADNSMVGNLFLIMAGVLSAAALVLPGISVSHFLLILGLYDGLLKAIQTMDVRFLMFLGLGVLLGIICLTKFLEYAMRKYPKPSYLIILGFMFASIGQIFPGVPKGFDVILCVGLAAAGFFVVSWLTKAEIEK